jgi:hypothetical protein
MPGQVWLPHVEKRDDESRRGKFVEKISSWRQMKI